MRPFTTIAELGIYLRLLVDLRDSPLDGQQAEDRHSLMVGNKARIIKVLKLPVEEGSDLPPVVGRLLGYDFYEVDEERVPHELDPAYGDRPRQAFLRKANKLAWDLAAQLTELQRPSPASAETNEAPAEKPATDESQVKKRRAAFRVIDGGG